jgi:hypothetical protein
LALAITFLCKIVSVHHPPPWILKESSKLLKTPKDSSKTPQNSSGSPQLSSRSPQLSSRSPQGVLNTPPREALKSIEDSLRNFKEF